MASKSSQKTKPVKKPAKKRKRKKSTDKAKHYVNAKDFFEQIKEYYKTEIIPDVLAESINKIAIGLSYAPNFINYSYKDEMIGDAILKMFSALKNKKFNVETGNSPFSYFTTIAYHAFINRIKKEKRYRETISKYQENVYSDTMNEGSQNVYVDSETGIENDNHN